MEKARSVCSVNLARGSGDHPYLVGGLFNGNEI